MYCTVNTVKPKAVGRTKADIASVRRLQLDLDEDGREGVARLRRDVDAGVVPTPAVIMQSSRDRYQVLWHASEGAWTPATAERMMTRLAGRYGGDHAVADVARVMRVPGFRNRKPARESWVVSWRQYAGRPVVPEEFERLPEVDRHPGRRAMSKQKMVGQRISRSERDWAWVRSSLRAGVDPEVLRRELERRRQDKPSPAYYAQRTVNRAVDSLEAERAR